MQRLVHVGLVSFAVIMVVASRNVGSAIITKIVLPLRTNLHVVVSLVAQPQKPHLSTLKFVHHLPVLVLSELKLTDCGVYIACVYGETRFLFKLNYYELGKTTIFRHWLFQRNIHAPPPPPTVTKKKIPLGMLFLCFPYCYVFRGVLFLRHHNGPAS